MDPIDEIAAGGQPGWSGTYEHQQHGTLTFRVPRLPTMSQWLDQAKLQDELLGNVADSASTGTRMLAATISTMETLMELPVVDRIEVEDPDVPSHLKVTLLRYDPRSEPNMDFPVRVYLDFINWRAALTNRVEDLEKGSGETTGNGSDDLSLVATVSP